MSGFRLGPRGFYVNACAVDFENISELPGELRSYTVDAFLCSCGSHSHRLKAGRWSDTGQGKDAPRGERDAGRKDPLPLIYDRSMPLLPRPGVSLCLAVAEREARPQAGHVRPACVRGSKGVRLVRSPW